MTNIVTNIIPKRVLVVDDNKQLAKNYRDLFHTIGWLADAVFDGQTAINAANRAGVDYDIVLLDMQMPGFPGLKTLDALREHHPDLCVIVFTGYGDVSSAVDAMRRGAAGMIEKRGRVIASQSFGRSRTPPDRTGRGVRQVVQREPTDIGRLQRVRLERASGGPGMEQKHVHAEPGETHPLTVDNTQNSHRLTFNTGLLQHLFYGNL